MNDWVIGLLGLSATGLVSLGIWLGRLSTSTRGAHKRIDALSEVLTTELREIRRILEDRLQDAWKHCPAAGVAHELRTIAELQRKKNG